MIHSPTAGCGSTEHGDSTSGRAAQVGDWWGPGERQATRHRLARPRHDSDRRPRERPAKPLSKPLHRLALQPLSCTRYSECTSAARLNGRHPSRAHSRVTRERLARFASLTTYKEVNMLAAARVLVVLTLLAGCGLPIPPNATPCDRAPGPQECHIWMNNRAQAAPPDFTTSAG